MKTERIRDVLLGLNPDEDIRVAYYTGDPDLRDFKIEVSDKGVVITLLPREEG